MFVASSVEPPVRRHPPRGYSSRLFICSDADARPLGAPLAQPSTETKGQGRAGAHHGRLREQMPGLREEGEPMAGRALVIDDDAPVRQLLVEFLRVLGWETEDAADGV